MNVNYAELLLKILDENKELKNGLSWEVFEDTTGNARVCAKTFYSNYTVVDAKRSSITFSRVAPTGCRMGKRGRIIAGDVNQYNMFKAYCEYSREDRCSHFNTKANHTEADIVRTLTYIVNWHKEAAKIGAKLTFNRALGKPAIGTVVGRENKDHNVSPYAEDA